MGKLRSIVDHFDQFMVKYIGWSDLSFYAVLVAGILTQRFGLDLVQDFSVGILYILSGYAFANMIHSKGDDDNG